MNAYHALAASYDRLTADVDYEAIVAFYHQILKQENVRPRSAIDLACGTGSVALLLAEEYAAAGYDVRIATNDGSVGKKGFVTELIPELLAAPAEKPFFVYGCGPKPMLMALAALMRKENMKGELSLDEIMCCGVGSCFGCVVKVNDESSPDKFRYARSCKEGPVFMAEDIYIGE